MDYRYLRQQLMKNFQQLVICELKEVQLDSVQSIMNRSVVYDLTNKDNNDTTPRKYYTGFHNYKTIIIVLEYRPYDDPYIDYLTDIYNLYGAIVKQQTRMILYDEMEKLSDQLTESDRQIHWIWFREKGFCLPDKIMSRAKSWIELNPTFKFYLWSNLSDQEELDEFLSALNETNRHYFTEGHIVVKYANEVLQCVEKFCHLYGSQLNCYVHEILYHLYEVTTETTSGSAETLKKNYKINRIFRTDILRVILLNIFGGIYCDFNDTICFYPMKYLLTMYHGSFFIGTDYDVEHPVFRNNYFLYNTLNNKEFLDNSIQCVNKAVNEYRRITTTDYMMQYYELCLEFLTLMNQNHANVSEIVTLVPIFLQSTKLKKLIELDNLKDTVRVINLVAEIFGFFGQKIDVFKQLSQRITQEVAFLDVNCLKMYNIKRKNNYRRKRLSVNLCLPIIYDKTILDKIVDTYEFRDYFLIKYAIIMTVGDLILSTNTAYIGEFKNLIPYSRSNRLSTISMMTHIYDGTSYGLVKNYETIRPDTHDLRIEFL